MRSEKAREIIDFGMMATGDGYIGESAAVEAVEVAEQELCDKFAKDIHWLVETWDKSEKKLDAIHTGEVEKLQSEIATLRTALDEANKRCDGEGAAERELSLNDYQQRAMTTCLPASANDCYMMFGLVEEVGELCGKVSKAIRKEQAKMLENDFIVPDERESELLYDAIKSETSDILWFVAGLCRQFGWTLEEVAQYNLDKLAARKQSNTIVSHTDH